MLKKIIQIFMALMLAIPATGQTVKLEDVADALPGPVTVDLDMLSFPAVGSVTFFIEYDDNLLTYAGPTSIVYGSGIVHINPTYLGNAMLALTWSSLTSLAIDETFVSLQFNYAGGFKTDLLFADDCEITTVEGVIITSTLEDGSITPDLTNPDGIATIGSNTAIAGADVTLPLSIDDDGGFNGVAASMTLLIGYDTEKLTFVDVSEDALGFAAGEEDGVISLILTGSTPLEFPLTNPVINLNFTYLGGGAAEVAFLPGSVVTDKDGAILITSFVDGEVTFDPAGAGTLTIATVNSVEGEWLPLPAPPHFVPVPVDVPVSALGLSSPLAGSIELKFSYDDDKLDYTGYADGSLGAAWNVTPTPGFLTFLSSNSGGYSITDGVLLTLKFDYYEGEASIKFLPGTLLADPDGAPIPVGLVDGAVISNITVNTKVILQGAWNGTDMNTTLLANGVLPLAQPYNAAPWNYGGSETVLAIPANVVDWILVELRTGTAAATTVARRAAFVLADGSVTDLDGVSPLAFGGALLPGDYFIVIKHRNHLAIMSATAQPLSGASVNYDFTDALGKAYDNPSISNDAMATLGVGKYGMIAGDGDGNGEINSNDRQNIWLNQRLLTGYYSGDFNMDNTVNSNDLSLIWLPNRLKNSHVPN